MTRPLHPKTFDPRNHDPWRHPSLRSALHAVLLASMLASFGCHTWRSTVPTTLGQKERPAGRNDVRLTFAEGTVVLASGHWSLDYPRIWGRVESFKGFGKAMPGEAMPGHPAEDRSFDLEKAQIAEVHAFSYPKTIGLSMGIPVALMLAVLATKSASCPIVQIDRGDGFDTVGEGYPGAVFRCLRREDLLALPEVASGPLSLRLLNLAEEIQYTDVAEVWAVDHGPADRVLATAEAGVVRVGLPLEPCDVRDLAARDVLAQVRSKDGLVWQTELANVSGEGSGPLRESLTATFTPGGQRPVLEASLENTRWTEVVLGRYFALMGDRFDEFMKKGNEGDPKAILAWRDREGVDLRVEVERAGRFETVAIVPATGAVELRHMAILLPSGLGPGPVKVRLSGATGFWRVDHLALSQALDGEPIIHQIKPTRAVDGERNDQLTLLAAKDGRFHALPHIGDRVDISFTLPALEGGRSRTCFLRTFGYYNPLPPAYPNKSLVKLKTIRDEPGALARFGLDFYQQNIARLHGGGAK